MGKLSFDMFKVPDQEENVCALAEQMVYTKFDAKD
jgi:hypothetical protein